MLYNVIQLPDSSLRGRHLCYIMLYNYLTGRYLCYIMLYNYLTVLYEVDICVI